MKKLKKCPKCNALLVDGGCRITKEIRELIDSNKAQFIGGRRSEFVCDKCNYSTTIKKLKKEIKKKNK